MFGDSHSHTVLILSLLVRATYIQVFFTHIPFVVNRTFKVTPTERLKHLQQGWSRLVEMTESERDKQNTNCFHNNLNINNLQSNLFKQPVVLLDLLHLFCCLFRKFPESAPHASSQALVHRRRNGINLGVN